MHKKSFSALEPNPALRKSWKLGLPEDGQLSDTTVGRFWGRDSLPKIVKVEPHGCVKDKQRHKDQEGESFPTWCVVVNIAETVLLGVLITKKWVYGTRILKPPALYKCIKSLVQNSLIL